MAIRRPHGRATTPAGAPGSAWAKCDGCGFIYDHARLRWRYEWRGPHLQNLRLLVCQRCYDEPQPNLKLIILPADPPPLIDARPEFFRIDEEGSHPFPIDCMAPMRPATATMTASNLSLYISSEATAATALETMSARDLTNFVQSPSPIINQVVEFINLRGPTVEIDIVSPSAAASIAARDLSSTVAAGASAPAQAVVSDFMVGIESTIITSLARQVLATAAVGNLGVGVSATAPAASATIAVNTPAVSIATTTATDLATATGRNLTASVAASPVVAQAPATATASNLVAGVGAFATAPQVPASVSARAPSVNIAASPVTAQAPATALASNLSVGVSTTLAQATATAPARSIGTNVSPATNQASATATTGNLSVSISVLPGSMVAIGDAAIMSVGVESIWITSLARQVPMTASARDLVPSVINPVNLMLDYADYGMSLVMI